MPRLTSVEAAARLGVKPESLYAYVSRGLISRVRGPGGSTFDPLEIEDLALSRYRKLRLDRSGSRPGTPLMVLETDLALIEDNELYLRGIPVAELASESYEAVARWLWIGGWEPEPSFVPDDLSVAAARAVCEELPDSASMIDRIQVATTVLGAMDPLRSDLSRATVIRLAGALLAGIVDSLPDRGARPHAGSSLARRLWPKLSEQPATRQRVKLLNAALVIMIEHDLAASTLAARAAASARAHPYGVVGSGLGALDSALHGSVSIEAYAMLERVESGESPETAIGEALRRGRGIPGFGHRLYTAIDPRAVVLFELLRELPQGRRVMKSADKLIAVVEARSGIWPNADLALAALTYSAHMPPDAGEAIFALARIGGWIAHALDEYQQPPLRLRPTGRYVGPIGG